MAKKTGKKPESGKSQIPYNWGNLVGITPFGGKEVTLWLQEPLTRKLRAVRVDVSDSKGVSISVKGVAEIIR